MRFKEGDKVEFIYLGELKQGVVTEIRASNFDISYQVKTEFTGTLWVTERDLVAPAPVLKVPQCVADWISHRKQEGYNLIWSISYENNDMPDEVYEWLTSTADNQELFARAWLDGYEVEKEPLYWVQLIEGVSGYLNVRNDGIQFINSSGQTAELKTRFTESEIKAMDKGGAYWQFAVLVDEVEGEA
ncbi:DUF1642 domain-containing protein [Listeria monocytogenes]|uniref:DUF1642 domain-containing protein n=1 Tax=Listeria monocytogenes TaxID=1639 RepID=UPI000A359811|nr:DUF1642 domain-containing protein [Listeria monocytogenes]EAC4276790.1 DUF1642 domain-containing protein [Listeria monocytogenes]EAD4474129.1 DUF1642 domain-containing protein [Listeria monocytogenes]EAD5194845.1 DUF1642 domain-containing protein [Listeria monocytogenes]EAE3559201.1 DUF1642 domain-containing protein [Listeria monocytogenes]EAE9175372.1 DUF1642 domain-containing protein [Listeria monocytogenes]